MARLQKLVRWLEEHINCNKPLLTNSCTAALEITAILADIQPNDEIRHKNLFEAI
jgi:dTDP-4-amino-4,6-dideoxygalactose transaminase